MNRLIATCMMMSVVLAGCGQSETEPLTNRQMTLPVSISNNAVAMAEGEGGPTLYSFNGLKAGKTYKDTSKQAFSCVIEGAKCAAIDDVPVAQGRLASAAVTVQNKIYVFGGYTVAEDGIEVSTPELFAFDPMSGKYDRRADMPVPVDDMVALPFQDRYIYLVSGWHDNANVKHVQLYDTVEDRWHRATDFAGFPLFGHSGGIVGDAMVIADGVMVKAGLQGARRFVASNAVWRGDIDPADPTKIKWQELPAHSGKPMYRMASLGDANRGQVIFAGGSDNPYNYDGVGYDKQASRASDRVFGYDLKQKNWVELGTLPAKSMDHRGLIKQGDNYYILGGMNDQQGVVATVTRFNLPKETGSVVAD